jgi:hypothetical protein
VFEVKSGASEVNWKNSSFSAEDQKLDLEGASSRLVKAKEA